MSQKMKVHHLIHPNQPSSSNDSDMDCKLAQERSKNDKLTAHIQELEAQVSNLQMSQADYNIDNDDDRHNNDYDDSPYRFSSPPVTTPLKTPIRNGENVGYDDDEHMDSLKEALKLEIKRSMAAEKKVADLLLQQQSKSTSFGMDIPVNDIIRKLLEQATNFIENDTHKSTSNTNTSDTSNTEDKMHEYYELVSAFCAEQESHSN